MISKGKNFQKIKIIFRHNHNTIIVPNKIHNIS